MHNVAPLQITFELLNPEARLPEKAHPTDACFDVRASQATTLPSGATGLVNLGWALQIEPGWEAVIRGRSGLAARGIVAHLGTVDHLYRQEVKVILHNLSPDEFRVEVGDRVAQLTFSPVYPVVLTAGRVEPTTRGGFGSTGMS